MNQALSRPRFKIGSIITSVLLHAVFCFATFNSTERPLIPEIIPLGLKVIPSIVKNDEIIPLIPTKKKVAIEKIVKKPKKAQVVKKNNVREGSKNGQAVSLKQRYLYELAKYIERNKVYPKKARKLKQQGRVFISFIIDANGNFQNLKLIKSSSFKSLDKGALKLLKNISTFKPLPTDLKVSSLSVTQPITYQIDY